MPILDFQEKCFQHFSFFLGGIHQIFPKIFWNQQLLLKTPCTSYRCIRWITYAHVLYTYCVSMWGWQMGEPNFDWSKPLLNIKSHQKLRLKMVHPSVEKWNKRHILFNISQYIVVTYMRNCTYHFNHARLTCFSLFHIWRGSTSWASYWRIQCTSIFGEVQHPERPIGWA